MFKRFFLFFAVNILIVMTISLVLNMLGIGPYLTENGINYTNLMAFCLVWGMGGSFISLMLSKWMAKKMMGVQIIDPGMGGQYTDLVNRVHNLARAAHLPEMPEVGIYQSHEVNAFATGPSKSNSLVAVSTGLLNQMDADAVEGVLAHEVAHIANGDMVTMTLIQGVINAFVMFFARVATYALDQLLRGQNDEEGSSNSGGGLGFMGHLFAVMFFEFVFGLLGMIVVAWFSRHREFRADAGGATLAGREKMVKALRSLQNLFESQGGPQKEDNTSLATLKISNTQSFMALFSTHPPLESRIRALLG